MKKKLQREVLKDIADELAKEFGLKHYSIEFHKAFREAMDKKIAKTGYKSYMRCLNEIKSWLKNKYRFFML